MHPKLSPTSNHWDQKNLDSETIHPAHSQAHIQTWAPNPCINQSPQAHKTKQTIPIWKPTRKPREGKKPKPNKCPAWRGSSSTHLTQAYNPSPLKDVQGVGTLPSSNSPVQNHPTPAFPSKTTTPTVIPPKIRLPSLKNLNRQVLSHQVEGSSRA